MDKKKIRNIILSGFSICLLVFVWWLVTDGLHLVGANAMASPIKVVQTFIEKLHTKSPDGATLLQHTLASMRIALIGYFLAVVIGIPVGIVMAWNKYADNFIRPIFDLLRCIPGIAWISLLVMILGVSDLSKYIVVFLAAVVPCILNSFTGIKNTRDVHLWVGQTFGASNFQLLWTIAVPTALPMIMTGVRVAMGAAWMTIVAAELLASTRGLGYMIQHARGIFRPDIIMVGMITIGILGSVMSFIISVLTKLIVKGRK